MTQRRFGKLAELARLGAGKFAERPPPVTDVVPQEALALVRRANRQLNANCLACILLAK